ncbi:MAG: hypothetical protein JWN95_412 [Frankiales bacterium]|nr:hypothetical protein [Frankiales bacterium]
MTDGTEQQPRYDGAPPTSDQFGGVAVNQPGTYQAAPYQAAPYQSGTYQAAPWQSAARSEPQRQTPMPYEYSAQPQPFGSPPGTTPYVPYPYPGQSQYGYWQSKSSNGMAVASLVLSICGFMFFGLPALLGIGLGIAGYRESKRTGIGRRMSISGIVIGILWVILYLALAAFLIAYLPDQA